MLPPFPAGSLHAPPTRWGRLAHTTTITVDDIDTLNEIAATIRIPYTPALDDCTAVFRLLQRFYEEHQYTMGSTSRDRLCLLTAHLGQNQPTPPFCRTR